MRNREKEEFKGLVEPAAEQQSGQAMKGVEINPLLTLRGRGMLPMQVLVESGTSKHASKETLDGSAGLHARLCCRRFGGSSVVRSHSRRRGGLGWG